MDDVVGKIKCIEEGKNGTMLFINPVNKGISSSSIKKLKEKCSKIIVEVSLSFNLSWEK